MAELNRSITPLMLWAMGVGCAFAGLFFGWNLGLARGGTLGLGLALVVVSILYLTFTLSYAELSCAIPRAGGVIVLRRPRPWQELGFLRRYGSKCGVYFCTTCDRLRHR